MTRRRDRIGYRDRIPSPLGNPTIAEKLAKAELALVLGRKLTVEDERGAVALAHLFSGHILDQDSLIEQLQAKLLEIHRRWA